MNNYKDWKTTQWLESMGYVVSWDILTGLKVYKDGEVVCTPKGAGELYNFARECFYRKKSHNPKYREKPAKPVIGIRSLLR